MPHRVAGHALAELARQDGARALRCLKSGRDVHKSVHEARKAIRRLRSTLSLVRHDLGDQVDPIDKALKRVGDGLSALRDAHVVIFSAEKMRDEAQGDLWPKVVERLAARRDTVLDSALAKDPRFRKREARLLKLVQAIEQLPWARVRKRSVEATLKHSEKRVVKARARFEERPRPALLHTWRKRVRRQRMQVQAWHKVTGKTGHHLHRQARALSKVSDALGWRQDLQVLRGHVRRVAHEDELRALLADIRAAMQKASL